MEGVLSQQHLIPSGLGAKTTAREAIGNRRLDGKTAIVTGGYAGIGVETTRVIALSSRGHVRSAFDFDDPDFERRPYEKMVAYGQSKTANVLFAVEADRRHQSEGIRAFALHPGAILETDLARNYDPEELKRVVERALRIGSFKTVEQGAATTIFCATSPLLDGLGGVYCENCDVAPIKNEGDNGVRPYAIDPDAAKRLWAWTERFI